jgi:hypothetical protein
MAIDFSAPLRTKSGLEATYLGVSPISGKHMVRTLSPSGFEKWPTTWHYDENGRCSVIGEPSDLDLINVANRAEAA